MGKDQALQKGTPESASFTSSPTSNNPPEYATRNNILAAFNAADNNISRHINLENDTLNKSKNYSDSDSDSSSVIAFDFNAINNPSHNFHQF